MSKTAIKSPTKKKPNQRFFTCMMRAYKHVPTYESGFEMAIFYDTVGHRAMIVAWVRELCGQQALGRCVSYPSTLISMVCQTPKLNSGPGCLLGEFVYPLRL